MKQKYFGIFGMCVLMFLILCIYQRGMKNKEDVMGNVKKENQTEISRQTEAPQTSTGDTPSGELCLAVPGGNPKLKILICSDSYESRYHEKLTLQCSTDYLVAYGEVEEQHKASELVWFTLEDPWLSYGAVTLTPLEESGAFVLPDLKRGQENPAYGGSFIIEKRPEGLLVINELSLEEYLYGVVPSEMPSDYPEEALKAQAICARTYALSRLQEGRGMVEGADLDDSVNFQVYNNMAGNEHTRQAVDDTRGQVMMKNNELTEALYYSTSCGLELSEGLEAEEVFSEMLSGENENAWEKEEPWYRWSNYYSIEEIQRLAAEENLSELGTVTGIEVMSREANGRVNLLEITGDAGKTQIEGEYKIRKFLKTEGAPVTLQDGSKAPNLQMLPSAFFYLTPEREGNVLKGYTLTGGGYGHGTGMSQNGARHMAESGESCQEILEFYYGKTG